MSDEFEKEKPERLSGRTQFMRQRTPQNTRLSKSKSVKSRANRPTAQALKANDYQHSLTNRTPPRSAERLRRGFENRLP